MIEAILDWLFRLFGKRTAGQLAGAAVVGAFFGAVPFVGAVILGGKKNLPPVFYFTSIVLGALVCFIAGLFLLSPRRFLGLICIFLGVVGVVVPLGHQGSSASMLGYAVKTGIGLIFLVSGVLLFLTPRRTLANKEALSKEKDRIPRHDRAAGRLDP